MPIRIHNDHHVAVRGFKSRGQGGFLAEVAREFQEHDLRVGLAQALHHLLRVVPAAIVHDEQFNLARQPGQYVQHVGHHPAQVTRLVESGHDAGNGRALPGIVWRHG